MHWIAFAVLGAYMLYLLPEAIRSFSHGGADAYAVWNLHARFLYRGGTVAWKDMFASSLGWTQNDYPLLLPGLVAGSWRILGAESGVVPPILGFILTALALGIVVTTVQSLARDGRGWIAGIILLATPNFVVEPVVQGADLPLSLYILRSY
jgi:hypothetical protein